MSWQMWEVRVGVGARNLCGLGVVTVDSIPREETSHKGMVPIRNAFMALYN